MSIRAINALTKAGFNTVDDCFKLTERKLFSIKNLGKITVHEILAYIKDYKLSRGNSDNIVPDPKQTQERQRYLEFVLAIPISEILFSVRLKNCLNLLKISHLKDVVLSSQGRILSQRNAGKSSLKELTDFLDRLDLCFDMTLTPSLVKTINEKIKNFQEPVKLVQEFRNLYPEKASAFKEVEIRTIKPERMEFYKRCFELYQQKGTLQSVAKEIKLTRERVRQILVKGTTYGLFEYKGYEYPYVSKEKLLSDLSKYPNLNRVSKINKISIVYLKRLLLSYHITSTQIEDFKGKLRKQQAIEEYNEVKSKLGHDPTTTELVSNSKWRSLGARISRYWGNFQEFRKELNIPPPPAFAEATKGWREYRSRLALIRRMQDLDLVRGCLEEPAPLNTSEIARKCRLTPMRAFKLTQMLMATGEVSREGIGSQTKYRISRVGGNK